MNIVIDQARALLRLTEEIDLLSIEDLKIFVVESEWEALRQVSRITLNPFKCAGIIQFIDEGSVHHSQIFKLSRRFGAGVAINNYLILQCCIDNNFTLVTSDPTIINIAETLRISIKDPTAIEIELIIASFKTLNNLDHMRSERTGT